MPQQLKIHTQKTYQFIGFNSSCKDTYKNKLMALGFLPGKIFKTIRKAPFGGPIEIKIGQTRLALRKFETNMLNLVEI